MGRKATGPLDMVHLFKGTYLKRIILFVPDLCHLHLMNKNLQKLLWRSFSKILLRLKGIFST